MKRSRLEPQQRREQLLDTAAAMFAAEPYEDVMMEGIAGRAGVSRALLYRYFPSKRDLYVAMFKRASHQLLARANPDPQLPLVEQLASGLEAHIQYFADHPFEAIAINRGALSDDPAIQSITTEELNVIAHRLTDKLVAEGHLRDVTEIAVDAWLAFVRAACVKWVDSQKITRAGLTEMCLHAFDCVLWYPETPYAGPKELTGRRRRRGAFGSVTDLTMAIVTGRDNPDRGTWPFRWKDTANDIIAKVQRSPETRRLIELQADH